MKTTPHIAVGIVIVLLILAGVIYFFAAPKAKAPTITATSTLAAVIPATTKVSYACDAAKTISATYTTASTSEAAGSVVIALSDGRTFNLPQVVSGSGIRYEEGVGTANDVQFSSEGNDAFLVEDGKTTYDNCVAGNSSQSSDGMQTFSDQGHTFTFSYPSEVSISGGGVGYSTDWMLNATTSGLLLVKATLPSSFEPKTNLADSTFTVGTSPDPAAVASCLSPVDPGLETSPTQTVTINGVQYAKFVTNDAGAGNLYFTTSYRTVRNNQCYAIEYTIHSAELGNYSPDQGISAFDQAKVQAVFEGMVQSFSFE